MTRLKWSDVDARAQLAELRAEIFELRAGNNTWRDIDAHRQLDDVAVWRAAQAIQSAAARRALDALNTELASVQNQLAQLTHSRMNTPEAVPKVWRTCVTPSGRTHVYDGERKVATFEQYPEAVAMVRAMSGTAPAPCTRAHCSTTCSGRGHG